MIFNMSLINRVVVKCFLTDIPLIQMNDKNNGRTVFNTLLPAPPFNNEGVFIHYIYIYIYNIYLYNIYIYNIYNIYIYIYIYIISLLLFLFEVYNSNLVFKLYAIENLDTG